MTRPDHEGDEAEILRAFVYFWIKTHYAGSTEAMETRSCEQCGAPFALNDPDLASADDVTGCWFMATGRTQDTETCRKDRWLLVQRELTDMGAA
jgi:hypothetical protein